MIGFIDTDARFNWTAYELERGTNPCASPCGLTPLALPRSAPANVHRDEQSQAPRFECAPFKIDDTVETAEEQWSAQNHLRSK